MPRRAGPPILGRMNPGPLAGQRIALVGRFATLPQIELAELIPRLGGQFQHAPTRATTLVVVGQDGWPLDDRGLPTQDLLRARRYRALGYPLEIVAEEDFLARFGASAGEAGVHRRYSLAQLARLLDVPGRRLRAWMRVGLIEPVELVQRLPLFDFAAVANARRLVELSASGIPRHTLLESLRELREWMPNVERPLAQLAALSSDALVVRLNRGQLAETSGQLRFDFDEPAAGPPSITPAARRSVDEWFDEGLALEDAERFAEAAEAYAAAIELDPADPVLRFNRGNVLAASGRAEEAVHELTQATRLDAFYAEAWLNLSNVLCDLDRRDEALQAGRHALRALPDYADAHYNLAQLCEIAGLPDEARQHWESYLALEPRGASADEVRQRLRS